MMKVKHQRGEKKHQCTLHVIFGAIVFTSFLNECGSNVLELWLQSTLCIIALEIDIGLLNWGAIMYAVRVKWMEKWGPSNVFLSSPPFCSIQLSQGQLINISVTFQTLILYFTHGKIRFFFFFWGLESTVYVICTLNCYRKIYKIRHLGCG